MIVYREERKDQYRPAWRARRLFGARHRAGIGTDGKTGHCWKPFCEIQETGGAGCGRAEYPFQLFPSLVGAPAPLPILTPHPKEFERLFGSPPMILRAATGARQGRELQCVIVLRGIYLYRMPGGKLFQFHRPMPA